MLSNNRAHADSASTVSVERRIRGRIRDLDAMPFIFRKLVSVINKTYPSAREIGEVISADQSLSIRVLRMVNSAAVAAQTTITSVPQAVGILGINTVRSLTLCMVSYDCFFKGTDPEQKALWRHSLATALLTRNFARAVPGLGLNADEMFMTGMLHDVGVSLLAKHLPKEFKLLCEAYRKPVHPFESEMNILGVTHADVGSWACEHWKLPDTLRLCVYHHHYPAAAENLVRPATLVHLADGLALQSLTPGHAELEFLNPEAAAQDLSLTEKIDVVVPESLKQLAELEAFVEGGGGGGGPLPRNGGGLPLKSSR